MGCWQVDGEQVSGWGEPPREDKEWEREYISLPRVEGSYLGERWYLSACRNTQKGQEQTSVL